MAKHEIQATIIKDSRAMNSRLTTMLLTMPRIILPQFSRYRMLSMNVASMRAISAAKIRQAVLDDPYIPSAFGAEQVGMSSGSADEVDQKSARMVWSVAAHRAVEAHEALEQLGVHKEITNRLLETFAWVTVVATGNERAFRHMIKQRLQTRDDGTPEAQHDIAILAREIEIALDRSEPEALYPDEWHLPFVDAMTDVEIEAEYGLLGEPNGERALRAQHPKLLIAVGRCARVSYLAHGKRDVRANVDLALRLRSMKHPSPFEHVALFDPLSKVTDQNFSKPWVQARKLLGL